MRRIVREQNQTLVMVTHDNHLATFADRQFHIVDGKILKIEEQYHPDDEDFTPETFLEAELHTQPPESPDTPGEPDSGSTPDNQLTEA